ncbi:MAG: outer membrane beta-barrel protein [Bdellovibrionota bacterium]
MTKFSRLLVLAAALVGTPAFAGYFELSANGFYSKYTNGKTLGELNTETTQRSGAGLAYNFFGNMLFEFKYTNSKSIDKYTQLSESDGNIYRIRRTTQYDNYGFNLVLEFAPRKAEFRPYISGGIGYMKRKASTTGTSEDEALRNGETALNFQATPDTSSMSADAGIGFKIFIAERLALDGSFSVLATDLDKAEVYLHYSGSAGLRFFF